MAAFRPLLAEVVAAVAFEGPTAYSWFGRPSPPIERSISPLLTPDAARALLQLTLERQLYADFYCRGRAQAADLVPAGPHRPASGFAVALSRANAGAGSWQSGWRLRQRDGERLVVERQGLSLWVPPEACRPADGEAVEPGTAVRVRMPKEQSGVSPGFYMALSDSDFDDGMGKGIVRLYWHLAPAGAVPLVESLTTALNRAQVPFKLKLLNDPAAYRRCDAAVLYIHREDYEPVRRVAAIVYGDLEAHLRPQVPAFTKRLAAGLGLADDPGDGDSFGTHRCRLLAAALISARDHGATSGSDRLAHVEAHLAGAGIDLEAPYLNPGSHDDYAFSSLARSPGKQRTPDPPSPAGVDDAASLATAVTICRALVEAAVWHQDRCQWLGSLPAAGSQVASGGRYGSIGPDLYTGAAGVGLLLAELAAATDDAVFRTTASAALRNSLAQAESIAPPLRLGLYTGWTGIAVAAARAGRLLQEERLLDVARDLASRLRPEVASCRDYDFMSGLAGAIVGSLTLRGLLGDETLVEFAAELAEELLGRGRTRGATLSWPWPAFPNQPDLTGLSHGAAGAGLALIEVARATGEARYEAAARACFEYERTWFDPQAGNWYDLRNAGRRRRPGASPLPSAVMWCHGAGGIALSRLRHATLFDDERSLQEALIGLRTTQRDIEAALRSRASGFILCHGLAGNADILLTASRTISEDAAANALLARRAGAAGIAAHTGDGQDWRGEDPSLMTGLAGAGYFYLRLARPETASVLLPLAAS